MKKVLLPLLLACVLVLNGCGHRHRWIAANCEQPKTCEVCGRTEGEASGHSWEAATCTQPKICRVCHTTEGAAWGHIYGTWSEPQLDQQNQWVRSCHCMVCGDEKTETVQTPAGSPVLGSAGELEGVTLLISIFADDAQTSWDFQSARDQETLALMSRHLKAGVDWLTYQVGNYGVSSRFLYQWEEYPDLCYSADFGSVALVRADGGGYQTQADFVTESIPTRELIEKYGAQNAIYIFFFNTDEYNTVNSWCMSASQGIYTEIINVFVRDDYSDTFYYMPASSFAHELLHCFGAHDLYYASEAIPQAYVDHCAAVNSNDIMYTVCLGETVIQTFTRLDAYYVGLIDSCEEVDIWGLAPSTHTD